MARKEGIVLYSSRTGYSKRYAEHIAQELDYAIKPIQKANLFQVSCYPTVIFGGGLHHNRIDGIEGLTEGFKYFGEQNLIIFSVGLASVNDELIKQIKAKNFPDFMEGTYFYHALPGGLSRSDTVEGAAMGSKDLPREARRRQKAHPRRQDRPSHRRRRDAGTRPLRHGSLRPHPCRSPHAPLSR